MKKLMWVVLLSFLHFSSGYSAENYLEKLKKPIIKEKNGTVLIEHYDRVNLKEKTFIIFKEFKSVLIKTTCEMKKDLISPGNFTAICVAVSTGFSQGLFQPVFDKIDTVEWVLDKPDKKADFNIGISFNTEGVTVTISHERGSQKLFIPYKDIIITKVNP